MTQTVASLKEDLIRKVPNLNNITGVDGLIEEAARNVLARIDPQSTINEVYATQPFYDAVNDYAINSDVKALINLSPVNTSNRFYAPAVGIHDFSLINNRSLTIGYRGGIKTLSVNANLGTSVTTVSDMEILSEYTALNNGTDVELDQRIYLAGSHSIKFGVTAGGSGGVLFTPQGTFSVSTQTDLFVALYIPSTETAGYVDTLRVVLTADDNGKYTMTTNSPFNADRFEVGWNIVRFDILNATKASVASTDIETVAFTVINSENNTIEGLRIDSMTLNTGTPFRVQYYSDALFRTEAGVFTTEITDDTNLINLDTDSYNILLYEAALLATEELEDRSARWDRYDIKLNAPVKGLYPLYQAKYGTQRLEEMSTYYDIDTNTGAPFSNSRF